MCELSLLPKILSLTSTLQILRSVLSPFVNSATGSCSTTNNPVRIVFVTSLLISRSPPSWCIWWFLPHHHIVDTSMLGLSTAYSEQCEHPSLRSDRRIFLLRHVYLCGSFVFAFLAMVPFYSPAVPPAWDVRGAHHWSFLVNVNYLIMLGAP